MKLTWHIVLKDLRRLRLPLFIWFLLMVGQLCFYAVISGRIGQADLVWMERMRQGPFLLLRGLMDPVMVFVLAGWLGYEDPLAARDAFWVTRPISGGRLLAAKLIAAGLMFGLLPVLVNLPWWLACSLHPHEIFWAAVLTAAPLLAVAVVGLSWTALTDGFPRYVLWSLVSFGVAGALEKAMALTFLINFPQAGRLLSAMTIALLGQVVVSLVVLCHQFFTRRLVRSVVMMAAGLVAVRVLGSFWSWDATTLFVTTAGPDQPGDERLHLTINAPARYAPRSHFLSVPLTAEGLPDNGFVWMRVRGEWSWDGVVAWKASGNAGGPREADVLRRMMRLPGDNLIPGMDIAGMRLPKQFVERMVHEPAVFRGEAEVYLYECTIAVELPLQEQKVRNENGSFSLSDIRQDGNTLTLDISERSTAITQRGLYLLTGRRSIGQFLLMNRKDGTAVMGRLKHGYDATLNLVGVGAGQWTFKSPAGPEWFKDAVLVSLEFTYPREIKRTIETNDFRVIEVAPAPKAKG
jgi:hypothetical protein